MVALPEQAATSVLVVVVELALLEEPVQLLLVAMVATGLLLQLQARLFIMPVVVAAVSTLQLQVEAVVLAVAVMLVRHLQVTDRMGLQTLVAVAVAVQPLLVLVRLVAMVVQVS